MTFKEWFTPFRGAEIAYDQGRKEIERTWVIPGPGVAGDAFDSMNVHIHHGGCTGPTSYELSVSVYHQRWGYDVSRIPARALRQIAAVKDYCMRWVQGEIADLPAECPREILELR